VWLSGRVNPWISWGFVKFFELCHYFEGAPPILFLLALIQIRNLCQLCDFVSLYPKPLVAFKMFLRQFDFDVL
jgi:hypothetical protein